MAHCRMARSRQHLIHKVKSGLGCFPLSCLHIIIITLAFYAWMLSSSVPVEILIDCGTYKYLIWKTLGLHLIKPGVWFCSLAAFSFIQVLFSPQYYVDINVIKNLQWIVAIFILAMFACNAIAFFLIFGLIQLNGKYKVE